jgi:hypothetical protein
MESKVYYRDPDMEITEGFIRAKTGIFPINDIVAIEARRPVLMMVAGTVLAVLGLAAIASPGASAGEQTFVIALVVLYGLGFIGYLYMIPVFVRTTSGLTKIGVPKFPGARRAIMQAFAEAKGVSTAR